MCGDCNIPIPKATFDQHLVCKKHEAMVERNKRKAEGREDTKHSEFYCETCQVDSTRKKTSL